MLPSNGGGAGRRTDLPRMSRRGVRLKTLQRYTTADYDGIVPESKSAVIAPFYID